MESQEKKQVSLVDTVFDAVTAWAAQGLGVAKKGLEASARWLDGQAKAVGTLAEKLAEKAEPAAAPEAEEKQPA